MGRRLRGLERRWRQRCAVVLDAGCGMGEVTAMLADLVGPAGRAVGMDRVARLVDRAQERASGVGALEPRVSELTSLPFDAARSECVFVDSRPLSFGDRRR